MAKQASRYIEALRLGAQLDVKAPPGGTAAGKFILVPSYETEQVFGLSAASTSQTIYICDTVTGNFVVAAVAVRFGTASSSGTVQVEVAGNGQAVGAGVNQLTAGASLSGAANTTVNGAIIAAPTVITAGSAVNVILGGTLTGLANAAVIVTLQRVA